MRSALARRGVLAWASVLALIGCGGEAAESGAGRVEVDGLAAFDAWVRPSPAAATEAAFYVTLENGGSAAKVLLGGRSNRCLTVVAHRTTIDDRGVASMVELDDGELDVAPGATLEFVPNGLHLMCVGLDGPLRIGDDVTVDLVFETGRTLTVPVAVTDRE